MGYTKNPTWQAFPSTTTPVTAAKLNHLEDGLEAAAAVADAAAGLAEQVSTVGSATGTVTLVAPSTATVHALTMTGNVTIAMPSAPAGAVYLTLILKQDATGGRTTTWPSSVAWTDGVAPTLDTAAGTETVVVLFTINAGSSWTGILSATGVVPVAGATVPNAPGSVNATADADSIVVTWAAPSNGGSPITGYKLYRGASAGSVSLYQTLGNVLTYDDTAVTAGTEYFYKVTAVNAIGESAQSSADSAAVAATPTLIAQDTFNRTNTTTGLGLASDGVHTWEGTDVANWNVTSNVAVGINNSAVSLNTGDPDVAVEAVRAASGSNWGGLVIRADDAFFTYMAIGWRGGDGIYVYRNNNVFISEPSTVVPVGGTLRVEVIGSSWTIKVNGVVAHTFSESFNLTRGRHGLVGNTTADDFKVYSL